MNSIQIRASSPAELEQVCVAYTATRVRIVVADRLSVDFGDISDSSSFTEDLGANRSDFAGILSALREEFDCELPNNATDAIHTVGDAIHYIMGYNGHRTAGISLANSAERYWLQSVDTPSFCKAS